MGSIQVSGDYFKTLGMQIISGRDFVTSSKADTAGMVFNEAAVKRLRLTDPVNQIITWNKQKYRVIGVAKDALMNSPYSAADPTMFNFSGESPNGNLLYRLSLS